MHGASQVYSRKDRLSWDEVNLAQVEAWLDLPISVRPGGLIRGSAGIGKTAFCSQVEDVAGSRGWSVIRLQASQVGHSHAVMTALTERLLLPDRGLLDRIGAPARAVLALLSPLAGPAETLQGSLGRHQVVIGAIRRLLVAAGNGDSIMLQVDDAHLADDAEIEVLMQLCCAGPPICGSVDAPAAGRLATGPFNGSFGGRRSASDTRSDPAYGRRIRQAGHPVCQIKAGTAHARAHRAGGGRESVRSNRADALRRTSRHHRLPQTIRAAVIARLCDLPEAAMATLKWMALAGDVFSAVDALALTPDAESHAFGVLDLALDAGVLVLTGSDYRFRTTCSPGTDRRNRASSAAEDPSPGRKKTDRIGCRAVADRAPLARGRPAARGDPGAAGRRP